MKGNKVTVSKVSASVRGVKRTVHLEKEVQATCPLVSREFRARVYSRSQTVSGVYREYKSGIKRFFPQGVNSELV